jgi:hypothetical protein
VCNSICTYHHHQNLILSKMYSVLNSWITSSISTNFHPQMFIIITVLYGVVSLKIYILLTNWLSVKCRK